MIAFLSWWVPWSEFRFFGSGFRVWGLGLRVQSLGIRASVPGFRVQNAELESSDVGLSFKSSARGAFGAHTNIPLLYREVAGLCDLGLRVKLRA